MYNSLLRIMLVDDEESIRNLLKACIDWKEIGAQIVGEASSGREALDFLEEINPDIIITDIQMPFMDGLEFSRIAAERYPFIKIVILTAYEEFEYAKKGIKVGIADFLLKPIKRTELRNSIINLKDKIEAERISRDEYTQLKNQIIESFPYLKEKFLNDLLQRNYYVEEIKEKLLYFSLKNISSHCQIALIEPSRPEFAGKTSEEDNVLLDLICSEIVKQYFKNDNDVYVFVDNSNRIVILNSNIEIDILECCEQIKVMIINRLKCYVCIGIGNKYDDLRNIKQSYKEACEALKYKVIFGKNQVVSFADMRINNQNSDINKYDIFEVGFYIKAGIVEKANELIDLMFSDLNSINDNTIEQVRVSSVNIVTTILNSITELGLHYDDVFETNDLPYHSVLKIDTMPEMKDYLKELLSSTINAIKSIRSKKANKIINDIEKYMKNSLSNSELSLSSVAGEFYLNSSYLSRIFKQDTGHTFVEYLTKLRIEKALKLFSETDLKAYEVAQEVGIPDPNYFGKCFKKYTGVSINDYKKT